MIKPEHANAGYLAATQLLQADESVSLEAIPGSELYKLTRATATSGELQQCDEDTYLPKYISDLSSQRGLDNQFTHDIAQADAVDNAVSIILANVDIAKNKVNPLVRNVLDTLNNLFATEYKEAGNVYSIITDNIASPCDHAAFDGLIAEDVETPFVFTGVNFPLNKDAELSGEAVLSLVETGKSSFDKAVKEYFQDGNTLQDIYWSILRYESRDSLNAIYGETGRLLGYWLVAKALIDNPPAGTTAYIAEYNGYLKNIVVKAAQALKTILDTRSSIAKVKVLIKSIAGSVIHVNGDVYPNWLDAGGTPEALMGYVIETGSAFNQVSYDTILDDVKHFELVYRVQEKARQDKITEDKLYVFRRLWTVAVRQVLQTSQEYGSSVDILLPKFQALANDIQDANEKRLWAFIRQAVTDILFADTDAAAILKNIDEYSEKFQGITIDEAFQLTAAKYVTDWVSQQIRVIR